MAGKAFSDVFCSILRVDRLSVYLASTARGALRVGLGLDRSERPAAFFERVYPHARLAEEEGANRSLAEAVEAALANRSVPETLRMDVSLTAFQEAVLKAISTIPFGETQTYGAVASRVGNPQGARAVGQVMGMNPLPLIFP